MAHADRKQFSIYLTDEQNEKITKYAKKLDISKQRMMSNLLDIGLEDVAVLDKMGVLFLGARVRDLVHKIKNVDPDKLESYYDESEES